VSFRSAYEIETWADDPQVSTHMFPVPDVDPDHSTHAKEQAEELQKFNGATHFCPTAFPLKAPQTCWTTILT
jgi:hypothetical protein